MKMELKRSLLFILLTLFVSRTNPLDHRSQRIVRLEVGDVQGFIVKPNNRGLGKVEVFLGIPYAAAPIGSSRFMPPNPPFPWSNVLLANRMPPVCPQKLPDVSIRREALKRMPEGRYNYLQRLIPLLRNQNEDCLYLNIYVPVREENDVRQFPVMVYIHGESYEWNSGNPYDGSTLASYGRVIVITVNFRLGILGFLRPAVNENHVSNFGLLDQTAALVWIKDNIREFGGNPEQVTIIGHGTGAALTNLLLLTPVTQAWGGLFKRAILMSGSALSKWSQTWDPYKYTIQVAKAVGCRLNNGGDKLLVCLREKTVDELLNVRLQTPPFTTPLGPIVDKLIIQSDPQRTMSIESSQFGRYELMYGVTKAESYSMLNAAEVQFGMSSERKNKLLRAYVSNNFHHQASDIYSAIQNEYKEHRTGSYPDERMIRDQTLEILSDAQIVAPVVNMGNYHSELNPKSYFYVFNHQTSYGDYPVSQGTVHGEELAYVFGAPLVGGFSHFSLNYTQEEMYLSELVMTMWTNFAKTGNPNLPTPQGFLTEGSTPHWDDNMKTLWPTYDKISQEYLDIAMHVVKDSFYRAKKLGLWNRLIPDLESSSRSSLPDLSYTYPGLPYPTITLLPAVKTDYPQIFAPTRGTTPIPLYPDGPKPIKSVQTYRDKPNPSIFSSDGKKTDPMEAKESKVDMDLTNEGGVPYTILIVVGVVILVINCVAMAVMYYQRDKIVKSRRANQSSEVESETNRSEKSEDGFKIKASTSVDNERKSRRHHRSEDKTATNSTSSSRVSSASRDSFRKAKLNETIPPIQKSGGNQGSASRGHSRSKSDHTLYFEIDSDKKHNSRSNLPEEKLQAIKSSLVSKNVNRSSTSIASKSSIKSNSSKISSKSTTSKTSSKSGLVGKPVKKNASCQSLPSCDYGWNVSDEEKVDRAAKPNKTPKQEVVQQASKKAMKNPSDQVSATLPRSRPPPPPRSTSLTAGDIQEIEKLQDTYRKKHSLPSSESGEMSGSEPFYTMGGGESPARAPGFVYGAAVQNMKNHAVKAGEKPESPIYDQFQRHPLSCAPQMYHHDVHHLQPTAIKQHPPFTDNRIPRGPLASINNSTHQPNCQSDYGMSRLVMPTTPSPPPVPSHQIPLTPSIMKATNPMLFHNHPLVIPQRVPMMNQNSPSLAMFDQTENTGTIRRQKPRNSQHVETPEKPLKSALKVRSAYDKQKNKSSNPTSFQPDSGSESVLTPSSPSSSTADSCGGFSNSSDLKGILVKRSHSGSSGPSKQTHFESDDK